MTSPHEISSEAAVQALVNNAERLGLTWDLKPATVQRSNPLEILMDGDDANIGATSMIGPVGPGQRVYVLVVPPSGLFVVGVPGLPSVSCLDSQVLLSGVVAGSSGLEVAIASASFSKEPAFIFAPGLVYELILVTGAFPSAATDSVTAVRIRKGSATTSGTQYAFWQIPLASSEASNLCSHTHIAWVKNGSTGGIETKLSITNARVNGAASTSLFGDSNIPMILTVKSVGAIGALPNLASIATQV